MPDSLKNQILKFVREHPGCARKDILAALPEGTKSKSVSNTLGRLQNKNVVVNHNSGRGVHANWWPLDPL